MAGAARCSAPRPPGRHPAGSQAHSTLVPRSGSHSDISPYSQGFCPFRPRSLPRKDTVFRQRDLLSPLVVQLEAGEADVIGVTPAGQELELKNDWGALLRKNRCGFPRSKEDDDKYNIGM